MMWRFSILLCFLTGLLTAQSVENSVFLKYYSDLDQMEPDLYYRMQRFIPDTAMENRCNAMKPGLSFHLSVTDRQLEGDEVKKTDRYTEYFRWDEQNRLIENHLITKNGLDTLQSVKIKWLIARKPAAVTVFAIDSMRRDSLRYQYNRSGLISAVFYSSNTSEGVQRDTSNRLYDSKGRLIVATGMYYGDLKGNFVYSYDNENRIVSRKFTTSTGVFLCADTLMYQYNSEARSVVTVTHLLKIGADGSWIALEQRQIYVVTSRFISHTQYFMPEMPPANVLTALYTVRYEYDTAGRLVLEAMDQPEKLESVRTKYYYSELGVPDSVVIEEFVSGSRSDLYRVYRRDVRTYDSQKRLALLVRAQYTYSGKKRKVTKVRSQWIHEERYTYQ